MLYRLLEQVEDAGAAGDPRGARLRLVGDPAATACGGSSTASAPVFIQLYGMAEIASIGTLLRKDDHARGPERAARPALLAGRASMGVDGAGRRPGHRRGRRGRRAGRGRLRRPARHEGLLPRRERTARRPRRRLDALRRRRPPRRGRATSTSSTGIKDLDHPRRAQHRPPGGRGGPVQPPGRPRGRRRRPARRGVGRVRSPPPSWSARARRWSPRSCATGAAARGWPPSRSPRWSGRARASRRTPSASSTRRRCAGSLGSGPA